MNLSIITINRNNKEGLRKTMKSVFAQTNREFEYIVVDGASTDGSVDIIKEFAKCHATGNLSPIAFTWLSEPDTGIYNAMNKGVRMAHGEYTLMLNSGDYLVDEHVIERIMPELHTEDMIQGNIIVDFSDKTIRNRGYGRSNISLFDVLDGYFLHQATFIRLSAIQQYGYYDEAYTISSDTYFFIKALGLNSATFRYIDLDIANFDPQGISSKTDKELLQIKKKENSQWRKQNIPQRIVELHDMAPRKILLYDTLHRNPLIWFFTKVLYRIAKMYTPINKRIINDEVI